MSRPVPISVELPDHLTILQIPTTKSTTGSEFLTLALSALGGIPEIETHFYGFSYVGKKTTSTSVEWIQMDKRVWKQLDLNKSSQSPMLHLRFRFFPEDVTREVDPYSMTLKLLYLQIKDAVNGNEIECSYEVGQELARAEISCKIHVPGAGSRAPIRNTNYSFHFKHHQAATSPVDIQGMLTYLQIAQRLPSYGITFFEGRDKTGLSIYLGIHAFGISVHNFLNRAVVDSKLSWGSIRNIKFVEKKLIISFIDATLPPVLLIFQHGKICDEIFARAKGNHQLYFHKRRVQA